MNCIQQRNPLAGFLNQHHVSCHYCEEPAEYHYNVGHACGNVCFRHGSVINKQGKRVLRDDVEAGIFVIGETKE